MKKTALLCLLPLLLAGCGDTRLERAGSGAVIGGTIGLGVGFICCGDPFVGPKVGGAIGAAVGGVTGAILEEPLFFDHDSHYWPYDGTMR